MTTIPALLLPMVTAQTASFAVCMDATLVDGRVFGFTSHDQDLTVDGVTYKAASGFLSSQMQWGSQLAVSNLEAQGLLNSDAIQEDDLLAGVWDFARIRIFYVNWKDVSQGSIKKVKGYLGEVRSGTVAFSAQVNGLMWALQQSVGRVYGPDCDAQLGDARCQVDLGPLTVTGTLTSVSSRRLFADSALNEPDNWYQEGIITMTSGANDGLAREVQSSALSGGVVSLYQPFPYDLQVGDAFSIVPGCLKRFTEDCKTKFNNAVNFQGFPDVPGADRVVSGR